MRFEEAIKYIQRTNSFKMTDAAKKLTSEKPNILLKPDEAKRKRRMKREKGLPGTIDRLYAPGKTV